MRSRFANAAERQGGCFDEDDRGENARLSARNIISAGVSPLLTAFEFRDARELIGDSMPAVMLKGTIRAYRRLIKSVKSIFKASPNCVLLIRRHQVEIANVHKP